MRLERDGVSIKEDQPTVVRVVLSEEAGAQLPIFERQSPWDLGGRT